MPPVHDTKFFKVSGVLVPGTRSPDADRFYPRGMPDMGRHRAIRDACFDSLEVNDDWVPARVESVGQWIQRDIMTEDEAVFYVQSGLMMITQIGKDAPQQLCKFMRKIYIRTLVRWDHIMFLELLSASSMENHAIWHGC